MIRWFIGFIVTVIIIFLFSCSGDGGSSYPVTMSLSATAKTPNEVELSWSPDTANGIIGYSVYRNGSALYSYSISGTSITDRHLQASTTYCYVIYSKDLFGIAGQSNKACIRTLSSIGWKIETIGSGDNISLAIDDVTNNAHISFRHAEELIYVSNDTGSWITTLIDDNVSIADTSIAIDILGNAHISYRAKDTTYGLFYANNENSSWDITRVSDSAGYTNSIVLDDSRKLHIAYSTSYSSYYDNTLMYATNLSGDWETHYLYGYSNSSIKQTDIGIDSNHVIHIAHATTSYIHYENNSSGSWVTYFLEPAYLHRGVSMDIDSNGFIHIVYMKSMELIYATNASGSWNTSVLDTLSWIAGNKVSIDVDANDKVHISYLDQNWYLKYVTNVTGVWKKLYIASAGDIGSENLVKVDLSGRVYILYTDSSTGTVKMAISP